MSSTNASTVSVSSNPLPTWYPSWARELADLYFSGTINTFVLYGNVNDLVAANSALKTEPANGNGAAANSSFVALPDFLATQLFGNWDVILSFDLGRGLRVVAGSDAKRLQSMVQYVSGILGAPNTWTRDPDKVLDMIETLIQRNVLEENGSAVKTNRVHLRTWPVPVARRRFGIHRSRSSREARSISQLGGEPVHQTAEYRILLDQRKAVGDQ